jgi:hypothetical protein
MNFENMPELKSRNGYFITLAVMAIAAIVLLIFFWWRGWIFQRAEVVLPQRQLQPDEDEAN